MSQELTQEYLKSILNYDPETGIITRIKSSGRIKKGVRFGSYDNGYLRAKINGKSYLVHRVAFLMHYGYLPETIDHINGIRDDNRISNIRPSTNGQNSMNHPTRSDNKSGIKGVHFNKEFKKWCAYISINNKRIHLGYFKYIDDAESAVKEARIKYHGEFANHGEFRNDIS